MQNSHILKLHVKLQFAMEIECTGFLVVLEGFIRSSGKVMAAKNSYNRLSAKWKPEEAGAVASPEPKG